MRQSTYLRRADPEIPQTPWAEKAALEIGATYFTRGEQRPGGSGQGMESYHQAIDGLSGSSFRTLSEEHLVARGSSLGSRLAWKSLTSWMPPIRAIRIAFENLSLTQCDQNQTRPSSRAQEPEKSLIEPLILE